MKAARKERRERENNQNGGHPQEGVGDDSFASVRASLEWFVNVQSLISSCKLHGLRPYDYLEQMLRLARHWPKEDMLSLGRKY